MDYIENYRYWCDANLTNAEIQELNSIRDNHEELKGRFGSELQFGTAGMRGVMGMGSNRLNKHTVRRAAQGMAAWLSGTDLPKLAAIGYDSRHNSSLFAQVCAVAFAEAGITAYLFDRLAPTPMLSYAVRALGCGCGIVISASHNSGEYNGVKCYGSDGCQMTDGPAGVVTEIIGKIPYFIPEKDTFDFYLDKGLIRYIDQELWESYYQMVLKEAIAPEVIKQADLQVVYTPLCGTGNEPVRTIFNRLGVKTAVVACQELPDGDFKTCEYPNPETDAALAESYKTAQNLSCDVILGTDPDCDRVAIAVPSENGFVKLSGNELGCLMLDYILNARRNKGDVPSNAIAVRSIVSSPLADRIAANYGVQMKAVLTGFKYIGGEILNLEEQGEEDRFMFGFEESCGYLKGTYARDKDAVVASMLVCEMAATYKLQGKTILDAMQDLYDRYGLFVAKVQSVELTGADAMEKAAKIMLDLRNNEPDSIGGMRISVIRDYKSRVEKDLVQGSQKPIDLPSSNVLEYVLGENGSVIVRPSGTEPKVKYYYTSVAQTLELAQTQLEAMMKQMSQS